jgi:hypothetical protein
VRDRPARGSGAAAKSGAFDPSCASWRSEGVGTKGVPQTPALSGGLRLACGASNKGLGEEKGGGSREDGAYKGSANNGS